MLCHDVTLCALSPTYGVVMDDRGSAARQRSQAGISPIVEQPPGRQYEHDVLVSEDLRFLKLKALEIEEACEDRADLRPLIRLAVSRGGLVSDEVRRKACMSTVSIDRRTCSYTTFRARTSRLP